MEVITLRNGCLQAAVLPAAGGGLARLDWLAPDGAIPLLRGLSLPAPQPPLPSQLACFPLIPWSNRIAPQGFAFGGRRIVPAPNRPGEPCPIHGDGWRLPWQVQTRGATHAVLELDMRSGQPFAYQAWLAYALEDATLRVTLEVQNTGADALPFGLGLHPWLPDPDGARLYAPANGVWLSGPDKLPRERIALPPAWDFSSARALPADGVDHVFCGWGGAACIDWAQRGVRLRIAAPMSYYILYAPPGGDFFCFEPVDHAINAHNLPGGPEANGLTVLAPGQSLRRSVCFSAEACA